WLAMLVPGRFFHNRMPGTVRVAAGLSGGSYDTLARAICESLGSQTKCEALTISTDGSRDNINRLEQGEVDLALVQADALGSSSLAIVAPLYYEAVHIVVRRESGIRRIEDLRGRRVNVGMEKAGTRGIAELVLKTVGMSLPDLLVDTSDWHLLIQQDQLTPRGNMEPSERTEAAIIVSRLGSQDMQDLLATGLWELLALPGALDLQLDEPSFHALLLKQKHYPQGNLPDGGVYTVATAAFLVATQKTPSILVETVLTHLFSPRMVASTGIFPPEQAVHWQSMGGWHPAAQKFFALFRSIPP
ncbi:MAG: TAXI family TRAP transporter solute-binding subunit, partial [bacterium]|nr:TAXI family TRAP transporter solute-binding subunit [bacterium]